MDCAKYDTGYWEYVEEWDINNCLIVAIRYRHGITIEGADLYCTTHPCVICLKMIINAGLQRVFYLEGYADEIVQSVIEESGFPVIQLSDPDQKPAEARAAG